MDHVFFELGVCLEAPYSAAIAEFRLRHPTAQTLHITDMPRFPPGCLARNSAISRRKRASKHTQRPIRYWTYRTSVNKWQN